MSLFCGKYRSHETQHQPHGREDEGRSNIVANRVSSCRDNINIFTHWHKHYENVHM